jgi:TolB protein
MQRTMLRPMSTAALVTALAASLLAACGGGDDHAGRKGTGAGERPRLSGVIVFRRFFDADHSSGAIFAIGADGRNERQLSHPPAGAVDSLNGPPGFMPHAAALVFDRTDANGNGSLWRVNRDGSGERRIRSLRGVPGDGWPAVSSDGRSIAVARAWGRSDRFEDLKTGLYVMRADGSSPRLVAPFGYRADVGGATWAPDGRRIVFSAHNNGPGRPADGSALFAVAPDGRGLRRITPWETTGRVTSPAFSPDGRRLLFQIRPPGGDFGGDYFTARADGSGRRRLTHFPVGSTLGSARWAPDGRWIVFANSGVAGQDDVFVMRADGTKVSPLTRTAAWESAPAWAP